VHHPSEAAGHLGGNLVVVAAVLAVVDLPQVALAALGVLAVLASVAVLEALEGKDSEAEAPSVGVAPSKSRTSVSFSARSMTA